MSNSCKLCGQAYPYEDGVWRSLRELCFDSNGRHVIGWCDVAASDYSCTNVVCVHCIDNLRRFFCGR